MRLRLQDMVTNVIERSEERVKLAADAGKLCGACGANPSRDGSDVCKACALKKERQEGSEQPGAGGAESGEEKTSSANIEKMAQALEYIAANVGSITPDFQSVAGLKKAAEGYPAPKQGPGSGPNTLDLNSATPGTQAEGTGQATGRSQPDRVPNATRKAQPTTSPTQLDNNKHLMEPGYPADGPLRQMGKSASIKNLLKSAMRKTAEDALNPAQISGSQSGLWETTYNATPSGEGTPSLPGEAAGQERMVASNQAAINYTKRDAKAVPKKRMREVLREPAQSRSTDRVLHANLDNADKAGVKLSSVQVKTAAAKAMLKRAMDGGCTCKPGGPSCKYCQLKAKAKEKTSMSSPGSYSSVSNPLQGMGGV